jgi:poly-gamma-glutamate capsule biosynthesis protein CapA/YwtB (metallophosphatase superfamily)
MRSIRCLQPLTKKADATILNLETPATNHLRSPFRGEKGYLHWADPELTPRLLQTLKVRAVSLGNNHSRDYGTEGLKDTYEALLDGGIEHFGADPDARSAARPWVEAFSEGEDNFKLAVVGGMHFRREYERRYHFYARNSSDGVNLLTEESIAAQIRSVSEGHPRAFIVIFPHWGQNYRRRTMHQRQLAETMTRSGADLVVGHGAHMFQEIARVNDRWVIYGLGNFVFNSPGRYDETDGHPFSLVSVLVGRDTAEGIQLNLRLYPILSDNRQTEFQPRFVTEKEFIRVQRWLLKFSRQRAQLRQNLRAGRDEVGHFLWLRLRQD